MEMSLLSTVGFANTFFHSMNPLFTPLMESAEEQKLLILM